MLINQSELASSSLEIPTKLVWAKSLQLILARLAKCGSVVWFKVVRIIGTLYCRRAQHLPSCFRMWLSCCTMPFAFDSHVVLRWLHATLTLHLCWSSANLWSVWTYLWIFSETAMLCSWWSLDVPELSSCNYGGHSTWLSCFIHSCDPIVTSRFIKSGLKALKVSGFLPHKNASQNTHANTTLMVVLLLAT